ncbi:mitochondrial enolase superfamily member 1 [Grus japonensis]|uniref:Mitochondrial enolase superfamily member 1 n=1 Tax=Grus japonensis TaxID=30415 RepID=A0ABC9Y7W3_GRUJA
MAARLSGVLATPPSFTSSVNNDDEDVLCPIFHVIKEDANHAGLLGYTAGDWPPAGPCAAARTTLRLVVWPVFSLLSCPHSQSVLCELVNEDVMGDDAKSCVDVEVNTSCCPPFTQ